jgi:hypothetical protein
MPEKQKIKIPDIDEMYLGPGKYEINRKLVEKDLGKGIP